MNKDYTHITMVIDRSGSMARRWNDVVGGYKEIIKENKSLPGKCTFTVAAFDDQYDVIEDFKSIKNIKEDLVVRPRGGTALLDAIGKTVVSVGEKLAKLKESDRPSKVIVMVQTDGEENSSKEYTKASIKSLIDEQTNKYNWQFMFIGASLSAVNDAVSYGFMKSNSARYDTNNSAATFGVLGDKTRMIRSATDAGAVSAAACFSAEDKTILSGDAS